MTSHTNGQGHSYLHECLEKLRDFTRSTDDNPMRGVLDEAADAITTALDEVQAAHRVSEEMRLLYEDLFDSCPDGYVVTNRQGEIERISSKAIALLGRNREEVRGHAFEHFILPDDRARFHEQQRRLAEGKVVRHWDIRLQPAHGAPIPIDLSAEPIWDGDGEPNGFRWLIHDLTDRKEMQIQLQEVRQRLAESREEERLSLAHELHDGPIQEINIVQWQLQSLQRELAEADQAERVADSEARLRKTLQMLRNMTNNLRPPVLEAFGLVAAMRSHAEQCQATYPDVAAVLDLEEEGADDLPEWTCLALFRIYQQALQNTYQHAHAAHIWVRLAFPPMGVLLEISDDGQGFSVPETLVALVRNGHLGLAGMQERVELLGGNLAIDSTPGEGTTIRVTVPRPEE